MMPSYEEDEDPFREGGEYEQAQIAIGARYGLTPEMSSLAGVPSRAVGREIVRAGFALFGGYGASEQRRAAKNLKHVVDGARNVERDAKEIVKVLDRLGKLFR